MNYAIISPDSSILAAVGDEDSAYFYSLTRDLSTVVSIGTGTKVSGWTFAEILRTEMDIGPRIEDKCCFTIAFSQSNKLCAIGSQSGVISVFDVESIREIGRSDKSPIVCYFNSSRHSCSGGAVRCMSFSPEPWDLLVWLEDTGRAGIADVRQAFIRRQILELNMDEPAIEEVETEPIVDESMGLGFDLDSHGPSEPRHDFEGHPGDRDGEGSESPSREGLIQDVAERERFIMEVLNTARWTSRLEDGLTDRNDRSDRHRLSSRIPPPHPHMGSRARPQGATGGANRASRPTSPRPIILSQTNHEARNRGEEGSSTPDPQPSITLSWTTSPGELQSATLDNSGHSMESNSSDQSGSGSDNGNGSGARVPISRPSVNFDYGVSGLPIPPRPRNHQRSRSAHRRPERSENHLDVPHRLRANIVAIERLQRQRQLANEGEALTQNHLHQLRRHTQQYTIQPPPDHTRSPRWIRSIINEMSDHSYGLGPRNTDPSTSAGLGFGADGRTLYIATVMGIFEYQINVTDRKTFPVITYR
ncbi:uncharacterized protein BDV17DRAFT_266159 [Aspergillus undulatus]|uniref:uncharacterized protein n=1 Tax=Aspergillus undulatus TaxID=1810928 RepID=UPI003CCCC266